MWVAQVPAFFRMSGGLLGLSKLGSIRLRSASRPFDRVVPVKPAPKPITPKMAPWMHRRPGHGCPGAHLLRWPQAAQTACTESPALHCL